MTMRSPEMGSWSPEGTEWEDKLFPIRSNEGQSALKAFLLDRGFLKLVFTDFMEIVLSTKEHRFMQHEYHLDEVPYMEGNVFMFENKMHVELRKNDWGNSPEKVLRTYYTGTRESPESLIARRVTTYLDL